MSKPSIRQGIREGIANELERYATKIEAGKKPDSSVVADLFAVLLGVAVAVRLLTHALQWAAGLFS